MEVMTVKEIALMVAPLMVLQIGLVIYCLLDISKNGVRNLNKLIWILIILFVNMFGAVAYLVFGRGDGSHAED